MTNVCMYRILQLAGRLDDCIQVLVLPHHVQLLKVVQVAQLSIKKQISPHSYRQNVGVSVRDNEGLKAAPPYKT